MLSPAKVRRMPARKIIAGKWPRYQSDITRARARSHASATNAAKPDQLRDPLLVSIEAPLRNPAHCTAAREAPSPARPHGQSSLDLARSVLDRVFFFEHVACRSVWHGPGDDHPLCPACGSWSHAPHTASVRAASP
jgi:hypothetical protein